MNWFRGSWAVLQKDLRLEMRSRYALNMLLMFVLSSLLLIAFSVGKEAVSERMQTALLWIVILFSASIGLGRSFVAEEEQGTVILVIRQLWGQRIVRDIAVGGHEEESDVEKPEPDRDSD